MSTIGTHIVVIVTITSTVCHAEVFVTALTTLDITITPRLTDNAGNLLIKPLLLCLVSNSLCLDKLVVVLATEASNAIDVSGVLITYSTTRITVGSDSEVSFHCQSPCLGLRL